MPWGHKSRKSSLTIQSKGLIFYEHGARLALQRLAGFL